MIDADALAEYLKANSMRKITFVRLIKILLGLAVLGLTGYGGLMLVLMWLFSARLYFFFPIPDCSGITLTISGIISDIDTSAPISGANIHFTIAYDRILVEQEDDLTSDERGYFEIPKSFNVCSELAFTVSAPDYNSATLKYSLIDHYTEESFPASPAIQLGFVLEKTETTPEAQ